LGSAAVAGLGAAASGWVIRGIAPGFTRPQTELATQLGRWLFLIIIPAGVAEAFRSFLLTHHRFALSTATGFIRNVAVVVVILVGFNRYGPYSIVLGYFAGYLLQVLVLGLQIVVCFPVKYSMTLSASGEAFRTLRGAGTAQLAGAMGWQGVVIVERIIASFLPPGSLTALNYGFKILGTLVELLGGSVGTAALPTLARAVAGEEGFIERKTFQTMLEISMVLIAPMTVFCLMLDRNIIRLIFQRGNFTPDSTSVMALVFFFYSLSLLPFSFIRLLTFYLFARKEAGIYLRLSFLQYTLTAGFDLLYVGVFRWGVNSIPLGLLSAMGLVCFLAFRKNLGNLRQVIDRPLGAFAAKTLAGCLLAALTVGGLRVWLTAPLTGFDNFLHLCKLCAAGSLVFFATLAGLKAIPVSQFAAIWSSGEQP
jgi:putative peptidoglycan lipid II flippase